MSCGMSRLLQTSSTNNEETLREESSGTTPHIAETYLQTSGVNFSRYWTKNSRKAIIQHQIFNRNTVKVSYGCTANVKHIIDGHNKSILTKQTESVPDEKTCNCNKPEDCPIDWKCLKESVIYQATVTNSESNQEQTNVGLTANNKGEFRSRPISAFVYIFSLSQSECVKRFIT